MNPEARTKLFRLLWLLALLPGLGQLVLLCTAMFGRMTYPFDLEWMEGGLLHHADRITNGLGIYVEPSIDFIPYLYTPLYPGLVAVLGSFVGISYTLGRVISVLAVLGVVAVIYKSVLREATSLDRMAARTGAAIGIGFFAATYPWVEGWYDLVRADSLFVLMAIGGISGVRLWATRPGAAGLARLGSVAALLALSFFCKQTGVLYVAAGGLMLLVLNWRRLPLYVGITGVIGLGGTWVLNRATAGWFWVYVREVHQIHDFSMDRFYKSFANILLHFPVMTGVIVLTLLLVLAAFIRNRRLPSNSKGFLYWAAIFAISCVVGAVGWGTQWAHFNAYIPAMTTGAITVGTAIAAILGALAALIPTVRPRARQPIAVAGSLFVAIALGIELMRFWWAPSMFIPSAQDEVAGHELVEILRNTEGEIFVPYHPWYAHMAGKQTYVHRMGLKDMTYANHWKVVGLREALRQHRFSMIVLDNRQIGPELAVIRNHYRPNDLLPPTSSPQVYTGAGAAWKKTEPRLIPYELWVPAVALPPPPDGSILFNFENASLKRWKVKGKAWGRRPVSRPLPKQAQVLRYGGRYFLSSFHGGDESVGSLLSPEFIVSGSHLSFRISGGKDEERLRIELRVDGEVKKVATGHNSEHMREVEWSVTSWFGRKARLAIIDESTEGWGHLNVDEVWMRRRAAE